MKAFGSVALAMVCIAVILGGSSTATAQDGTEERLRALEERLRLQEQEIKGLREALSEQEAGSDSLESQLDEYLSKAENASWFQEPNTFRAYWDKGLRFATADKAFNLKIGGRVMYDMAFYDPSDDYEDSFSEAGDYTHLAEFRRARIYFSGTIYDKVAYKAQYELTKKEAGFRELWVGLNDLPVLGDLRVGNFKEPFSLEQLTSSKYLTFIERSMADDAFVPAFNSGIAFFGDELDGRLFWGFGVFNNGDANQTIMSGKNFTARIGGTPVYEEKGETLVEVGASFSTRYSDDDMWEFDARPEAHTSKVKYGTGEFEADNATLVGLEAACVFGPFSAQGEYIWADMDSDSADDPTFSSGYIYVSYFLTGENRRWKGRAFSRVSPKDNFWSNEGGSGAWEIGVRYSFLDLKDGDIEGPEVSNFTFGVNWYWNPSSRFMLNWVYSDVDGNDGIQGGDVSILQFRFQVDF